MTNKNSNEDIKGFLKKEEIDEKDKILKEYNKLLNRILHKGCANLEHARSMIKIFNFYTNKGRHAWDWKKQLTRKEERKIYD